ncbi:hypothetical protein [Allokutzneria albata]|uniref:Phosphotransferase enzyme family protein n=1 Tax=Allokutzneria albata TaxID=211114 RepID=A0A1G9VDT0_ALLAB|nr:hypothetical protein [Allokutzneria albata]SDM70240.1 hypothetical protein SAMN04489726_2977 [Allokutzneria albata]
MEEILRTATAVLGTSVADPVDLGGSARSTAARCVTGDGGTVIVKAYKNEPEALRCFTAEAAGLALGAGSGPQLLAVDTEFPLLVMEDLGEAPSLADALLGDSADTAREALLAWARAYGRLAAETVGRQDEFAALRARYDRGDQKWGDDPWIRDALDGLPAVLGSLGVTAPDGLLAEVSPILGLRQFPVYSPGDICPDNNLFFPDRVRLLDFEGAEYHSVFIDAVYTRMPFSSCWCVFRLPQGIQESIEAEYRAEVAKGHPDLLDDHVWREGMRLGMIAWTLDATTALTPRVLDEDRLLHRTRRPVPSMRQLLRYRWETLLSEVPDLPATSELLRRLLAATQRWEAPTMPLYPAFAG